MNKKNWPITSRIELLLAKIAGHDVDLNTMTPPVASNTTEEMLLEIAERMDNGGGGGGIDLPQPTENNVGQSVAVSKVFKQHEVVVPEQLTAPDAAIAILSDVNTSLFVEGATVQYTLSDGEMTETHVDTVKWDGKRGMLYAGRFELKDGTMRLNGITVPLTVSVVTGSFECGYGLQGGILVCHVNGDECDMSAAELYDAYARGIALFADAGAGDIIPLHLASYRYNNKKVVFQGMLGGVNTTSITICSFTVGPNNKSVTYDYKNYDLSSLVKNE